MNLLQKLCIFGVSILIVGCGGGGGGSASGTTTITGIAATGAAITGGTVEFNCANGSLPSTTTRADGSFTMNTGSAVLPCILRASVPLTGQYLYSIVENGASTANMTPLSHLLSDILFGADSATVFANFTSTYAQQITATNIATAQQKIRAGLLGLGIDVNNYDVLKSAFAAASENASGDALDQKLDQLSLILSLAEKTVTELAPSLRAASLTTASTATASAIGSAATSFSDCSYVRSGKYWTFAYDGTGLIQWDLDVTAMTATKLPANTVYPVQKLTSGGSVVPCAFTITAPTTVITSYFSKSGVSAWKQENTDGSKSFGMGVPTQTTKDLTNSQYVGNYPALTYMSILNSNGQYLGASMGFNFSVSNNGSLQSAKCPLTNTTPICGALTSSNTDSNLTCGSNTQGLVSCTSIDGLTTVKAFAFTNQQQPTLFMLLSGTSSGLSYTALLVGTKAQNLIMPTVGYSTSSGAAWSFSRAPKNNLNTAWAFSASPDVSSGTTYTVASVNNANSSYTYSDGTTKYLNTPAAGMYWRPSVTNTTYPAGAYNQVGLKSNGGWSMDVTALPSSPNYDGISFFITKPLQ